MFQKGSCYQTARRRTTTTAEATTTTAAAAAITTPTIIMTIIHTIITTLNDRSKWKAQSGTWHKEASSVYVVFVLGIVFVCW